LDVDVEQQLLRELAGGNSLPDVQLLEVPLPDVLLTAVPLTDVPLPDVPLPVGRLDGLVGEERTGPCVAVEAYIQVRVGFYSGEFLLR
jgi:hypothetical protein